MSFANGAEFGEERQHIGNADQSVPVDVFLAARDAHAQLELVVPIGSRAAEHRPIDRIHRVNRITAPEPSQAEQEEKHTTGNVVSDPEGVTARLYPPNPLSTPHSAGTASAASQSAAARNLYSTVSVPVKVDCTTHTPSPASCIGVVPGLHPWNEPARYTSVGIGDRSDTSTWNNTSY